jgi:hypothetical protein
MAHTEFVCDLDRLAESAPAQVSAVLGKLVANRRTVFRLRGPFAKATYQTGCALGQRDAAIQYCNQLRNLPGMPLLFEKLRQRNQGV